MFKQFYSALNDISAKLDLLLEAKESRPAAEEDEPSGQGKPAAFKLDDARMQEGIANLMGYDPFTRKRSDEKWQ